METTTTALSSAMPVDQRSTDALGNTNKTASRSHFSMLPGPVGLYNPRYERDSCGVGCVADIKGRAHRKIVSDANKLLVRLTHRGTKQGEDGDGAGIMVGMPHRYFKKLSLLGQLSFLSLPPLGRYGVGMIFLPNGEENENRRVELMENIERVIRSYGLSVLGWRSPLPTKSSILGPIGRATEPFPVQIFVCRPEDNEDETPHGHRTSRRTYSSYYDGTLTSGIEPLLDQYDPESSFSSFGYADSGSEASSSLPTELPADLERLLFLVRKRLSRWTDMYVCSFSCRLVVYKGQLQSEQLFSYYDDLMDEDFLSYFAIVHARFSTNTFPTWDRAHPFRRIAHNGEINTIDCNRRWMIAKEGKASPPAALGLQLALSDIVPFEEPCHVTRFSLPGPPDMRSEQPVVSKKMTVPVPCGGVPHVRDSLAVPTDIVSARKSSVTSNDSRESHESGYTDKFSSRFSRDGAPYDRKSLDGTQTASQQNDESPMSYSSDSASLDGTLELLMMAGRDIAEAVMLLVPEAVQKGEPQWKRDYYDFVSCVMEPWDGPALVAFTDGLQLGAQLDRNGLRPGRFVVSKDGTLILASEVGVVDVPPSMTVQKGRLIAGKMLLVDFREGRIVSDEEIKRKYASKYPYGNWIRQHAVHLEDLSIAMTDNDLRRELQLLGPPSSDDLPTAAAELVASVDRSEGHSTVSAAPTNGGRRHRGQRPPGMATIDGRNLSAGVLEKDMQVSKTFDELEEEAAIDLAAQLTMFGYSSERVDMLLSPMAKYAAEVLGSMGNDTPLACLSELPRTPGDYFHQMFAQGTNPSIDPIRETDVMSLACPIGPQGDLFTVTRKHVKRIFLKRPVVNPSEFRALVTLPGFPTATVDLTVPRTSEVFDLAARLMQIQLEAEHAVREGTRVLILSDRRAGVDRLPVWSTMAVGAVHLHLIAQRLRLNCAILVETGEASEVHQIAMLLSSGADAVYPYVAYRALSRVQFRDDEDPLPLSRLIENYITAVHLGLLRVMSKIGVCTMLSYKGGFYFQPLGIASSVLRLCYDAGAAAIGGVDFTVFAEDTLRFHLSAFPPRPLRPLLDSVTTPALRDAGDYRFVAVQEAELHSHHPDAILYLQKASRQNDVSSYRRFSDIQNALVDEVELRGQLDFLYGTYRAIPVYEVEPAKDIVKRFVTGAMSYGSIAEEAYTTIARAMNAIGSRSNTGEGGECENALNGSDASIRNRTKQIGSARFGVTAAYLCGADELQIKCGQGASPGEGGELPGYKVVGKVAATRRSTPGVGLISPPPHHDMYSIEDVAQLIMDLKHANPRARVSLKLVSKLGIGVIAAGCVKAKADHLVISGASGGTGASKFSSIKHSGLPWEIGLAETHQTLCLNSLRERVALQVDGGLRTGRDVMVAALLGAEEFGFGTQPLISLGCVMNRKCHLNACPSGIATQDPELRKRFQGQPEHLINYFFMVAEEVRTYMARLGIRQFNQMIGRSDLLRPKSRLKEHWKRAGLDFHQSLVPGWKLTCPVDRWRNNGDQPLPRPMYCLTAQDHELDKVLDREIIRRARRSLEHKLPTNILMPIRNGDRSVGGLLAYEVSSRYGSTGLPPDTITVNFRGAAGQSFACWLPNGVSFRLSGDCNDFVGKGLSGGTIVVKPPSDSLFFPESDQNIICGNAALYGATSGRAFFAGVAGERFAIRNSGAVAVVEGCGDYGCEYMTRGVVLILGQTGRNFAAGMTGGIAYVLDLDPLSVNTQMVELQPLAARLEEDLPACGRSDDHRCGLSDSVSTQNRRRQTSSFDTVTTAATDTVAPLSSETSAHTGNTPTLLRAPSSTTVQDDGYQTRPAAVDKTVPSRVSHDARTLECLLVEHFERTKSRVAERLLESMPSCLARFTKVFPKEIKRVLKQAITDYVTTGSPDAAALLDDWETMTTQALKYDAFYLQTLPYTLRTFAENFQRRERQRKRVEVLDLHENALRVLGGFVSPSPLVQYAADLIRSGRLTDLLAEENFEQLTQVMKMTRTVYAHWRTGYSRGLRKSDSEMIKSLLPSTLTPSRQKMIKKLLLEERRQLIEHLRALEGSSLAESLLRDLETRQGYSGDAKRETVAPENEGESSPDVCVDEEQDAGSVLRDQSIIMYSGGGEWEAFVKKPSAEVHPTPSAVSETSETVVVSSPDQAPSSRALVEPSPRVPQNTSLSVNDTKNQRVLANSRRPFLARHPDRIRGFHLYAKQNPPFKNANVRVLDWEEVTLPVNGTSRLFEQLMKTQASRCMDCGTPTCHYPNSDGSGGCPLGNRIPTWNSLVYDGQWKLALERLLDTNNFPEFTGRVCPAPCESSCLLARTAPQLDGDAAQSVAIKSIEMAIIERGFQKGWIVPTPPVTRTSFAVAIVGSGPAGLAAAQQLNRAGHRVVVYEKEDRVGGLLMYGIPNMKLDKERVVQRRVNLLKAEGITFKVNTTVGKDVLLDDLLDEFNAVLLATGQSKLQDLRIPGRQLKGIMQGLDFLKRTQKSLLAHKDTGLSSGERKHESPSHHKTSRGDRETRDGLPSDVSLTQFTVDDICGKRVIVIGSGDLAVDCMATAVRLGCSEVIQFCSDTVQPDNVFRVEYGHEEAMVLQGRDPREYCIQPLEFVPQSGSQSSDVLGGVRAVRTTYVVPTSNAVNSTTGRAREPEPVHPTHIPVKGTERVYPADLVLLALGFAGVDGSVWNSSTTTTARKNAPVRLDNKSGNVIAPPREYRTNVKNLFACGDCRTGPTLVVSCIGEGRDVARAIDDFLTQEKHQAAGYQPRGIPIEWSIQQHDQSPAATKRGKPLTPTTTRTPLTLGSHTTSAHVVAGKNSIIKSESLPSIAPHLGFTEPTRTLVGDQKGVSVFVPPPALKVLLASGPISVLPSALPLWTNPLRRRYGHLAGQTCVVYEQEAIDTRW